MTSFDPVLALFDIGGGEFFVIIVVALILFGGRLPDVARTVGRTVGEWKRQADALTRDFRDEFYDAQRRPPPRLQPPKRSVGQSTSSAEHPDRAVESRGALPPPAQAPDEPAVPVQEGRHSSSSPAAPGSPGSAPSAGEGSSPGGSSPGNS